jgi:DNA-binding transcriptional regulator GbsR (MarR family)
MDFERKRKLFVEKWGILSERWGLPKSAGRVHAFLISSDKPLCAEDIIDGLGISSGSANAALRSLVSSGMIVRSITESSRKDYYEAIKDPWDLLSRVLQERRRKELEPLLDLCEELTVEAGYSGDSRSLDTFLTDVHGLGKKADKALRRIIKAEESFFLSIIQKTMK